MAISAHFEGYWPGQRPGPGVPPCPRRQAQKLSWTRVIFFPQHNTRVPDEKRRQLRGQVAGIVQELHNLPELTDTDRRVSRAVAFLLEGR